MATRWHLDLFTESPIGSDENRVMRVMPVILKGTGVTMITAAGHSSSSILAKAGTRALAEAQLTIAEAHRFRAAYRTHFKSAVDEEVRKVDSLNSLDASERARVRIAVFGAARCYHSTRWWPLFWGSLAGCRRLKALMAVALVPASAWIFWCLLIIPRPGFGGLGSGELAVTTEIAVFAVLGILVAYFHMPARRMIAAQVAAAAVMVPAIVKLQAWAPRATAVWRSAALAAPVLSRESKKQLAILPVAHLAAVIFYMLLVAFTVTLIARFAGWQTKAMASGRTLGYRKAEQESASLLLGFLEIVKLTEEILGKTGKIGANGEYIPTALPGEAQREELVGMLEVQSRLARRDWRDAMRTYHPGSAGDLFARNSSRIDLFLQFHLATIMFAGSTLIDLRDAMRESLVLAAGGKWHLIGSGNEAVDGMRKAAWRLRAKRAAGVTLPVAAAIILEHFNSLIPGVYAQTLSVSLFGFAGLQLLALVNPDLPDRFSMASGFAGLFSRSGSTSK
jgi:hypothetical protein